MFATITLSSNVSTIADLAAFIGTYVDRPIFEMSITSTRISTHRVDAIARIVIAVDDEDIQSLAEGWCQDFANMNGAAINGMARYGK